MVTGAFLLVFEFFVKVAVLNVCVVHLSFEFYGKNITVKNLNLLGSKLTRVCYFTFLSSHLLEVSKLAYRSNLVPLKK